MGIYVPKLSRCCVHHFRKDNTLLEKEIQTLIPEAENSIINVDEIALLLNSLRTKKTVAFDEFYFDNIDESTLKKQIGLSREIFEALLPHINISAKRTSSFILGLYLWKLRNGQIGRASCRERV